MRVPGLFAALLAGALASVGIFVWSGVYAIGADVPHWRATYWLLTTLRERSVDRAASPLVVPSLAEPASLLSGGADYNEMCATCHLRPGIRESDFSIGLYPKPPDLTIPRGSRDEGESAARRDFWIIKHGIKGSGMPAWGLTHDDQRIWAMVAFLRRLPELTPEQYQILTARKAGPEAHHR